MLGSADVKWAPSDVLDVYMDKVLRRTTFELLLERLQRRPRLMALVANGQMTQRKRRHQWSSDGVYRSDIRPVAVVSDDLLGQAVMDIDVDCLELRPGRNVYCTSGHDSLCFSR